MILETKLTMPQPKAGALLRTGLIDLIKNNLEKKLVLICAGAGYGKTTLLSQLVREACLPAVFIHLDKADSDLITFFSYLLAGLEKLAPGLAARSSGLLKQAEQIGNDHELLIGTLINELAEKRREELFIILDDYQHLIENSKVHQALDFLIDNLPDIVHVIIASRANVQLASLTKWFTKQEAFEVNRADLCFSVGEVNDLLAKSYGQTLSTEDLKSVLEHTEGWITGIQLILANIHRTERRKTVKEALAGYLEAVPSAPDGLFQYFAGEIFSYEPQKIRDFLAASAILETITAKACDAVLETANSEQLLQDLARRNLFLFRIGPGEYKYHRLFQEFLLKQSSAEAQRVFHQKAAGHYQRQGMNEPAIGHWLAAGGFAQAAGMIAAIADDLTEQGRYEILSEWLSRIPGEIIEQQPQLMVIRAGLLREQGKLDESEALFRLAQVALTKDKSTKTGSLAVLADALLEYSGLLWARGNITEALRMSKKALAACPSSESEISAHILNLLGTIYDDLGNWKKAKNYLLKAKAAAAGYKRKYLKSVIENNLADLLNVRGNTKQAFDQYVSLIAHIGNDYYFQIGTIFNNAARTALDHGRIDWAEKCLDQGQALCTGFNDALSEAALNTGVGCLNMEKGLWEQAEKCYLEAKNAYSRLGWNKLELGMMCHLGRLKRYCGEYQKAKEYYRQILAGLEQNDRLLRPSVLLELSIAESLSMEFPAAKRHLQEFQAVYKRQDREGLSFTILLANLIWNCQRHQRRQAVAYLKKICQLSQLKGYNGILARELRYNPQLAKMAHQAGVDRQFLKTLGLEEKRRTARVSGQIGLRVNLFGNLQIFPSAGDRIPLKWRFRKLESLFAYLIVHRNRVCNKEELMDVFWSKAPLKQADENLRSAVSLVKKTLEAGFNQSGHVELNRLPVVIHQEKGYQISPNVSLIVDAEEFHDAWQRAKCLEQAGKQDDSAKYCRQCLDLYRDAYLTNLGEQWCEEKREGHEKIWLYCLKNVASHSLHKNEFSEAIALYKKYIKIEKHLDAIDEQLHVNYWKALKARGWNNQIKKDYDRYCKMLKKSGEKPNAVIEEQYYTILKTK